MQAFWLVSKPLADLIVTGDVEKDMEYEEEKDKGEEKGKRKPEKGRSGRETREIGGEGRQGCWRGLVSVIKQDAASKYNLQFLHRVTAVSPAYLHCSKGLTCLYWNCGEPTVLSIHPVTKDECEVLASLVLPPPGENFCHIFKRNFFQLML